ncbi:hypothetical protein FEM48_Zijuj01G0247300 [Ziziphus jujuba var. spinosa]|uniref:Reverse transcriptase domain-containing protein n=1 Tax=Ziziphus jujuba var. spinosa TaxID=714518 RepID=A0A978W4J1_ZIZJJ|nr:hypothetical protein FEM48_Zijuj01G0247300 [Ziziphus jujuba var. spinosa]
MIIKMDLKKAYDRLEWRLLDKVLKAWGFTPDVRWMIGSCVGSVNFSLLLNENPQEAVVVNESFKNYCNWSGQQANNEKPNILFSKSPNALDYLALKAWKDICKPKELRGLAFRKFKDMNLAMLAKLE